MDDARALDVITTVRRACVDAGEPDPLDEAADLGLRHDGLAGAEVRLSGGAGFAMLRGSVLDLAVSPTARRRGVGGDLAAQVLPASGALNAWSHGDHPAAARLAERHGLARVRELWVMRRPTSMPLPDVEQPGDVHIRGYRPEDRDRLIEVNAVAFAAHPEQGAMDAPELARRTAEPWFDPEGLLIAEDDAGQMLGFHWTKQHDVRTGEVYVVAVSPRAQGRGLGRLLTVAGLRHLAAAGMTDVHLYVESENTPGIGLYTGLGFSHDARDTHVQYRRP